MRNKSFWQGWMPLTYGLIGGISLYCLLVATISYIEMAGLDKKPIELGQVVHGTLQYTPRFRSTAVTVHASNGEQWRCSLAYCSYEGIFSDYGKQVEAVILEGQIVQIQLGGKVKLTKGMWEAAHIRMDFAVVGLLLLSMCLALIRYERKQRLNPLTSS